MENEDTNTGSHSGSGTLLFVHLELSLAFTLSLTTSSEGLSQHNILDMHDAFFHTCFHLVVIHIQDRHAAALPVCLDSSAQR